MLHHSYSHNTESGKRALVGSALMFLAAFLTLLSSHVAFAQLEGGEAPATGSEAPLVLGQDGTDGASTDPTDPGTNPADPETASGGDASVTTGDASASTQSGTTANTNDTSSNGGVGSETTVANDNSAAATTTATTTAATGDNTALGVASATVTSGNANASANVINVINTNIFNAEGLLYFLNILFGNVSIDMRNAFSVLAGGTFTGESCTLESCDNGDTALAISNQNVASVENGVAVTASTGGNSATATNGSATVSTGDAYASANVVNFVNTNITGSNYLLLAVNNFGDFAHDIVFPGADWFKTLLGTGTGVPAGSETSVSNDNTAVVTTNGDIAAATGGNEANGTNALVTTGNATAAATVVNQVNTNVFGDSILFLFRIHGSWNGNVFGLPEGMSWRETGDGIELTLDPSGTSAPLGSTDRLSVANTNTATVTNNVSVYALTGDNMAEAGAGSATVSTGDAYASANVVNVVNTNVLGRNWVLAIFNIFGDWNGNISFGQPDLWVGARAVVPSNVRGGTCFNYEVTVNNLGDAAANNVMLDGIFDQAQQQIDGYTKKLDDRLRWHIGRIAAGGTKTVTLPACLSQYVPTGTTVTTEFEVDSPETDADPANNAEAIGVTTVAVGGGGVLRTGSAELSIEKLASDTEITASSSVDYTIVITNTGGPIYNALLVDTIYNENGKPIYEQRWGLDTIKKDETLIVKYTMFFNASTTPGTYTNKAFLSGSDHHPDSEKNYGSPIDSPIASVDVVVRDGTVAPTVDDGYCDPLLTTYIRYGRTNDRQEVSKLQYFLRTVEENGVVTLTGEYDEVTLAAVHAFQRKYEDDILNPWGVGQTTGYVYYTTQKKINELWCKDRNFPLSPAQLAEIESFKTRTNTYREQGVPVPETELREIGLAPAIMPPQNALAAVEERSVREGDATQVATAANDQIAAASEAITNEAAEGIWARVRSRVSGAFSWLGF